MTDLEATIRSIVRDELAKATAAAKPDEYLSTRAAAELADVAAETIRRWVRIGKLAEHRAGRCVRVSRADLERMLREGSRRVANADPRLTPEQIADRDFG